jgi:hypothetical protein
MELIETRLFTRQVQAMLTAEEYRLLQLGSSCGRTAEM